MKKYTIEWLEPVRLKPLTRATKAKPFPGKYPTRVAWQALYKGKRVSYVGKPSRRALRRFHNYTKTALSVWALEFDRNGVIAKFSEAGVLVNAPLRSYYHPVADERSYFFLQPFKWVSYKEPVMNYDWLNANAAMLPRPAIVTKTRHVCWPLNEATPIGII